MRGTKRQPPASRTRSPPGPRTPTSSSWSARSPTGTAIRPPGRDLLGQRAGDAGGGGGDEDAVEGRGLGPAQGAVADAVLHVGEAERGEAARGARRQLRNALDGVDAADEVREDRGLVAGPGPDLEHPVGVPRLERGGHQRDHERLGDGLPAAHRQRRVVVGRVGERGRHEPVAGNRGHGGEHARLAHAAAGDLHGDHAPPLGAARVNAHGTARRRTRSLAARWAQG